MVISPNIFSQIKRQSFFADTTFGRKFSFKISPESFKSVYVITLLIGIFSFAMFYQAMNVAFSRDTRIAFPGIRANDRTSFNPSTNQRHKGLGFNIRNNLSPYLAASAEDAKHRRFESAPASFGLFFPLALAFVFPLAAYVGLINFNRSTEDLRDISAYRYPDFSQGAQDTPAINTCFITNGLAAEASQKPLDNLHPFPTTQIQRQRQRIPFVFTACTAVFPSSDNIDFSQRTFRTSFVAFHATILSYLVARISLYPNKFPHFLGLLSRKSLTKAIYVLYYSTVVLYHRTGEI